MQVILQAKKEFGIEGVTLSGGEPILQRDLPLLLEFIHQNDLGTILFTGRQIESLSPRILQNVDLLIDGPFIQAQLDEDRVLLGSKNKQLHFLTNRYQGHEGYFYNPIAIEEVALGAEYIFINGD